MLIDHSNIRPYHRYSVVGIESTIDQQDLCETDDEHSFPPKRHTPSRPMVYHTIIAALSITTLALIVLLFASQRNSLPSQTDIHPIESDRAFRNHQMWARVIEKLHRGEAITIGFLGGSITHDPNAYHSTLGELLSKAYPVDATLYGNATVPTHTMLNRGESAMTSDVASLCADRSFPSGQAPDIVSLEYALNDMYSQKRMLDDGFLPRDNMERFARYYLSRPDDPPALMILLFQGTQHESVSDKHVMAAKHYGIPTVSWEDIFLNDWRNTEGAYQERYQLQNAYRPHDGIHPSKDGHAIMGHAIMALIQQMERSYFESQKTDLSHSVLSLPINPSTKPLLDMALQPLPVPMNPLVLQTSLHRSYCRVTYQTFGYINDNDWNSNATIVEVDGIESNYLKGDEKPSFKALNPNITGQFISFQSPIKFEHIAILLLVRSWKPYANMTAFLYSSDDPLKCVTQPIHMMGQWDMRATQTSSYQIWSKESMNSNSCVYDTLKVTKTSPGEMRIIGFYAN